MTPKEIDSAIDSLSRSQGFYGRLKRGLAEADESAKNAFYSKFENCSDVVDFVMALEC